MLCRFWRLLKRRRNEITVPHICYLHLNYYNSRKVRTIIRCSAGDREKFISICLRLDFFLFFFSRCKMTLWCIWELLHRRILNHFTLWNFRHVCLSHMPMLAFGNHSYLKYLLPFENFVKYRESLHIFYFINKRLSQKYSILSVSFVRFCCIFANAT